MKFITAAKSLFVFFILASNWLFANPIHDLIRSGDRRALHDYVIENSISYFAFTSSVNTFPAFARTAGNPMVTCVMLIAVHLKAEMERTNREDGLFPFDEELEVADFFTRRHNAAITLGNSAAY